MSNQITTVFVQQYGATINVLAQQKVSKLQGAVTVNPDGAPTGEFAFHDQVGVAKYNTVINRNGDTPLNQTPFGRRRVQLVGKDYGDLIDKIDKLQTLLDPTSATNMAAMMAMNRAKDDVIISAMFGTAYTNSGIDGVTPTQVSFPSGNIVAVNDRTYQDQGNTASGNSSLTTSKLIYAKEIMGAGNVDFEADSLHIAANSQSISALLTATPVTSVWYNAVKTLVGGEVDAFMGINFHRTELAVTNGLGVSLLSGNNALVPVWAKSGIVLDIGEDVTAQVAPNPGKRFSTQIYVQMFMGATRMEEVKVVQLLCDTTKTL